MAAKGEIRIQVCERTKDSRCLPVFDGELYQGLQDAPKYHAQVEDKPHLWGHGKNKDAAVMNLLAKHPDIFGVEIVYIGVQAR